MKGIIVVTGASSGFGRLTAEALALNGHTVYAAMRETAGRNAPQVQAVKDFSAQHKADLRAIELDVGNQGSVDAAIETIIKADGHIDTVVHNAGHMVFGPAEAFTPEQFAELYDINVLSTQRVNRAVLPHMRERHQGLLVWVSSSSSAGGTPPYLSPYFAAKAGMDALAVQYARELSLWGIETSIIVPGAFTKGTNHSPAPGDRRILPASQHTKPARMPVMVTRSSRRLAESSQTTPTRVVWHERSWKSSMRPSVSGHFVCITTPPKTAPRWPSPS